MNNFEFKPCRVGLQVPYRMVYDTRSIARLANLENVRR